MAVITYNSIVSSTSAVKITNHFPHLHKFSLLRSFYSRVSDLPGVIVLTLCVCLSVSLSQPNGQRYGLEFWHGGQVEGYLDQLYRLRE